MTSKSYYTILFCMAVVIAVAQGDCSICGEGQTVTNAEASFDGVTCLQLEQGGLLGIINCDTFDFPDNFEVICGCAVPTISPAPSPLPSASDFPTPKPSATPNPVAQPTPEPSITPNPVAQPTPKPSATPNPVAQPTPKPSITPNPVAQPTPESTTSSPNSATSSPTLSPTKFPTSQPTPSPTPAPATSSPTLSPTKFPTSQPTPSPTPAPAPCKRFLSRCSENNECCGSMVCARFFFLSNVCRPNLS